MRMKGVWSRYSSQILLGSKEYLWSVAPARLLPRGCLYRGGRSHGGCEIRAAGRLAKLQDVDRARWDAQLTQRPVMWARDELHEDHHLVGYWNTSSYTGCLRGLQRGFLPHIHWELPQRAHFGRVSHGQLHSLRMLEAPTTSPQILQARHREDGRVQWYSRKNHSFFFTSKNVNIVEPYWTMSLVVQTCNGSFMGLLWR